MLNNSVNTRIYIFSVTNWGEIIVTALLIHNKYSKSYTVSSNFIANNYITNIAFYVIKINSELL